MERMFTVSQVAAMLGLGIDAVRFYEKKGLVHPQINPENRYRMYSLYQIMELLDVSYYRSLGMSISEIRSISEDCDEERLIDLLREKRQQTQRKLRYEQQMLKRIEYVEALTRRMQERGQGTDIVEVPPCYILFEQREDSLEDYLAQVSGMDHDHYIFCQLAREFSLEQGADTALRCVPMRTLLLMNCSTAKELDSPANRNKVLPGMRALHSIVQLPNADLRREDVASMLETARRQGLHLENRLLMREVPMISYTDLAHYYAELFIPLAETEQKTEA